MFLSRFCLGLSGLLLMASGGFAAPKAKGGLRPQSQAVAAASSAPFRLIVPVMGLDIPVARGTDNEALRRAPGYDPLSALPGEAGNCVIASHRNVHGAYFWYLTKVRPGATITLQTPQASFDYRVISAGLVPETQTEVLENLVAEGAPPHLTLYTCTLPVSKNRYVVRANLVTPAASAITSAALASPAKSAAQNTLPVKAASLGPFGRPAVVPEITSGPVRLLKDPKLRARYQALLRYAAQNNAPNPVVLPDGGAKVEVTP